MQWLGLSFFFLGICAWGGSAGGGAVLQERGLMSVCVCEAVEVRRRSDEADLKDEIRDD
jgi:hypothetical protein